jgi:tRNA-2-methylthio-N6-dimethylallyladenosine synthase
MNTADSEIVHAVLEGAGLVQTEVAEEAHVILINTCAVSESVGPLLSSFPVLGK